mgnify:CR=1 FL=1
MIRRPPRSTQSRSSAASDVYKRQVGEYAELPAAGLVDTLPNKTTVDVVGYGVQEQAQIPGNQLPQPPPRFRWNGLRVRL